jgi:hypothetical protein
MMRWSSHTPLEHKNKKVIQLFLLCPLSRKEIVFFSATFAALR